MSNERRIESIKRFPVLDTLENGDKIKVNQQTDDAKLPGGSHHGATLGELNIYRQEIVSLDKTLTAADSGKTIMMSGVGEAITLPALAAGLKFKFMVSTVFDTTDWTVTSPEGTNLEGAINIANTLTTVNGATTVTFELGAENIGDFAEMECDGTSWLVNGVGLSASSISLS